MTFLRAVLRSPLLHFFVLGALVFAFYAARSPVPGAVPPNPQAIVLTPEDADALASRFAAVWNRPPTAQELQGLMQDWVTEEALVREARALGLDEGDEIVRDRLRQKMLFLAEAPAASRTPDTDALETYYRENAARFRQPGRVGFAQVLLPQNAMEEDVSGTLEALRAGSDPEALGSGSLLPARIDATPLPGVDRIFGIGFAARLVDLPEGQWTGPVESGYGRHLVRLDAMQPGYLPPLEVVRDRVLADWRAQEMKVAREAFTEALRSRYRISLPAVGEPSRP
ncbi:conserved hypothetical protein [Citreicella sp. SE45]|nr:conserved hypothetical protein [Citreicella sp. SE45]